MAARKSRSLTRRPPSLLRPSAVEAAHDAFKPLPSAHELSLLNNIVPKHEPEFSHRPRLVLVRAAATEGGSRRDTARMNVSEVSANEEAAFLEGGRYAD